MKLTLKRIALRAEYTIGKLYINDVYFCDVLEDTVRKKKIPNCTAIPQGEYTVELTYSPKFKRMMPMLLDVPGFSGIRIHSGNTHKDTAGCLLVGRNTVVGGLTDSKLTYNKLFEILRNAHDEKIKIEII